MADDIEHVWGPETEHERIVRAAATVLAAAALDLIQHDPHQWSTRPCGTCSSISRMIGRRFGCILYREQRAQQEAAKKAQEPMS